jgi:hypothetical protein
MAADGLAGEDFCFTSDVLVWCALTGISRTPVFLLATCSGFGQGLARYGKPGIH